MSIWNLGSINADFVFSVPHIPAPGETLMAGDRKVFLGGKGANMSVAAARAAARVHHIGCVGEDAPWTVERLMEYGVDTRYIREIDLPTTQAMIFVDPDGENAIVLAPGANTEIPQALLQEALTEALTEDWLLIQNETNLQRTAAKLGSDLGLRIAYAAAPFDAERVAAVLPYLDFLILNQIEADQLKAATGKTPDALDVEDVIVTLGAQGADWYSDAGCQRFEAVQVDPLDTTGAGDTFTGYVLAGIDRGMPMGQAIRMAMRAAALMVTRHGTADVIPDLSEVQAFMG